MVSSARSDTPLNILYINADDLGVMDVGYNSDRYRTPNIDQLAKQGMTFTSAYAAAANCAPSRACVFSGQTTSRHGVFTVGNSDRGKPMHRKLVPVKNTVHLKDEQVTIAEVLNSQGYRTIHLGKWHLGDDPTTQGFDINIGGDASGSPAGGYFAPFKRGSMSRFNDEYPAGTHRADIYADQAQKFLRDASQGDQPFFLHMAYYSVHTPLQPVPEFVDRYRDKNVQAAYASMIQKMDESIGKILNELDRLGMADNTVVVFSSDNGGICKVSKQTPHRAGKGSYFEGGTRVPLVIRWPMNQSQVDRSQGGSRDREFGPGGRCDVPITGLDFYPTFAEIAGATLDPSIPMDGTSITKLLAKRDVAEDRTLCWHFPVYLQAYAGAGDDSHDPLFRTRPGTTLMTANWKLHQYFEDDRLELYDLTNDPGERENVVGVYPEKARKLKQQMDRWRSSVNAPLPGQRNPAYESEAENAAIEKANRKKSKK